MAPKMTPSTLARISSPSPLSGKQGRRKVAHMATLPAEGALYISVDAVRTAGARRDQDCIDIGTQSMGPTSGAHQGSKATKFSAMARIMWAFWRILEADLRRLGASIAKVLSSMLLILSVSLSIPALASGTYAYPEQRAHEHMLPSTTASVVDGIVPRWPLLSKVAMPELGGRMHEGRAYLMGAENAAAVQQEAKTTTIKRLALALAAFLLTLPIISRVIRLLLNVFAALSRAVLTNKECVAVKMIQVVAVGPQAERLQKRLQELSFKRDELADRMRWAIRNDVVLSLLALLVQQYKN
jgi:hypothetical protein